ncbi:hypothetical protein [Enterobacter cloacae complex sp. 357B1]
MELRAAERSNQTYDERTEVQQKYLQRSIKEEKQENFRTIIVEDKAIRES